MSPGISTSNKIRPNGRWEPLHVELPPLHPETREPPTKNNDVDTQSHQLPSRYMDRSSQSAWDSGKYQYSPWTQPPSPPDVSPTAASLYK